MSMGVGMAMDMGIDMAMGVKVQRLGPVDSVRDGMMRAIASPIDMRAIARPIEINRLRVVRPIDAGSIGPVLSVSEEVVIAGRRRRRGRKTKQSGILLGAVRRGRRRRRRRKVGWKVGVFDVHWIAGRLQEMVGRGRGEGMGRKIFLGLTLLTL